MYDGSKTPYAPASFLHAFWTAQPHMAGYGEKDAHEFFMSLLNQLHVNCNGQNDNAPSRGCACVVHQVFAGLLESRVVCHACGGMNVATDEFLDLRYDFCINFKC